MWTYGVVVLAPSFDLSSGVLNVEEPVLVQTFQTEPAVEGIAVGVVGLFFGSRKVEDDAVDVDPEVHLLRCELTAIVQSDALRIAELGYGSTESFDDIGCSGLAPSPETGAHAAKVTEFRQDSHAATVEELVVHPIHRTTVVRRFGWLAIFGQFGADPSARWLVPHLRQITMDTTTLDIDVSKNTFHVTGTNRA